MDSTFRRFKGLMPKKEEFAIALAPKGNSQIDEKRDCIVVVN
jgi:hypothetical protein